MAELTVDDVEVFTNGRLSADGVETGRLLVSALRAARQWCGWRVNLVEDEEVLLDSQGGRVLSLPTLALVELSEIVEDGVALDVGGLRVSTRLGCVSKKSGACWASGYGVISATMTHGLDDPDDADFNQAVLQAVDSLAAAKVRGDMALTGKKVDDVEYTWSVTLLQAGVLDVSLLAPYRILLSP